MQLQVVECEKGIRRIARSHKGAHTKHMSARALIPLAIYIGVRPVWIDNNRLPGQDCLSFFSPFVLGYLRLSVYLRIYNTVVTILCNSKVADRLSWTRFATRKSWPHLDVSKYSLYLKALNIWKSVSYFIISVVESDVPY